MYFFPNSGVWTADSVIGAIFFSLVSIIIITVFMRLSQAQRRFKINNQTGEGAKMQDAGNIANKGDLIVGNKFIGGEHKAQRRFKINNQTGEGAKMQDAGNIANKGDLIVGNKFIGGEHKAQRRFNTNTQTGEGAKMQDGDNTESKADLTVGNKITGGVHKDNRLPVGPTNEAEPTKGTQINTQTGGEACTTHRSKGYKWWPFRSGT